MVNRSAYLEQLHGRIQKAEELILDIDAIAPLSNREFRELGAFPTIDCIPESTKREIREKVKEWFCLTRVLVESGNGINDPFVSDFITKESKAMWGIEFKNTMKKRVESGKRILENIIQAQEIRATLESNQEITPVSQSVNKPRKVFISHKKEDQNYADALVNLINFIIGPSGDKVFCSSIPGYGIKQSRDIMDELKAQFDNFTVFMVIIHSPRYYQSFVCLNEMGASWALGTKFSSFMTKDCTYELLHGVIGREKICININDEAEMLKAHLNDFKNDLLSFFSLEGVDENKWEHARNRFVKEVSSISYDPVEDAQAALSSKQKSEPSFSDEENAILKKWAESNNSEAHSCTTKDGTSIILGQYTYEVKESRELLEWEDFLNRMIKAGFIKPVRKNRQGSIVYRLSKPALDYIESLV